MHRNLSRFILALFISACLAGCKTQMTTAGRDFDASKIGKIDKEFTTSDELVALLGKPNRTWVWSADGTMWEYSWQTETNRIRLKWAGQDVITDGYKKQLQVLIKYDRVVNYTYYEGPFHTESKAMSGK